MKFTLTYRNEFYITVEAESKEDAIDLSKGIYWTPVGDLWEEYLKVEEED